MPAESRRPFRSVGIDLDGVLANQVELVLPLIESRYGVSLTYDDITDWRLPIGPTDIATEIVAAQADHSYVLTMPVHAGAREMLEDLRNDFWIVVLTARGAAALEWSIEWLRAHSLPFDEIAGSTEAKKSLHGVGALVDDYLGNVEDFLRNASGPVVLVDQPWNRKGRAEVALSKYSGRLATVTSLLDVPSTLRRLVSDDASSRRAL
jgi:uncharacterized HAD superfamily protein